MSAAVLDASIAIAWCLEDEASPETDGLFPLVRDGGAAVPALWYLEVANVLLLAERRGKLAPEGVAARLDLLAELPIRADAEGPLRAWRETMALGRAENLTAYDASYLELARRLDLPLLTADRDLSRAASRLGIRTLPGQ